MNILIATNSKKGGMSAFAFAGKAKKKTSPPFDGVCSIMYENMELEFAMKNAQKLRFDLNLRFADNFESLVKKG